MSVSTPIEPAHAIRAAAAAAARTGAREAGWTLGGERLALAVASVRGLDHPDNEDAHSPVDRPGRLLAVADGVGSGALASLASRTLVEHLHRSLADGAGADAGAEDNAGVEAQANAVNEAKLADAIRRAVLDADRAVQARLAERTALPGAATLALCLRGPSLARWSLAWVGDCRVYRLPAPRTADASAHALTRDDSYANLGEPVPAGGSSDDPARMVGNGAVFEPNVTHAALGAGEGLLLCSDGLHRYVPADQIGQAFAQHASLAAACDALVAQAREQGSRDDVTLLALRRSIDAAAAADQAEGPDTAAHAALPQTAHVPRSSSRRAAGSGVVWLVLAVLLLAAGVALAWWLVSQRAEDAPERAPVLPADPAPPAVRIER